MMHVGTLPTSVSSIPVEITGNLFFSDMYLLKDKPQIHSRAEAEQLIAYILDQYTNEGFAFCAVFPEFVEYDTLTHLRLKIAENERIIVSDALFEIKGKTLTSMARRIANYTTGCYFSSQALAQAKTNLDKRDIYESIHESIVQRDEQYYILFSLEEKESDYITAAGSLAEDSYVFNAAFYSLNLLGTLRTLQFRYEHEKLFSLELADPVLIFPIELNTSFGLWTYDSARLLAFDVRISAPVGRFLSVSLISGIENTSYYNDVESNTSLTHSKLGVGIMAVWAGVHWGFTQSLSFDYLFRDNDRWRFKYDAALESYDFHIKPYYRRVYTDSFEYFDYFRLGGAHDLRGYLDEEFTITRAYWVQCEYRRFMAFPIFDIGLIEDKVKYSYGLGIEARTAFARTSLIIAWPQDATWRDGKIHLLFEKGF
jgi:outer membrane protein assembly factor BamA